MSWNKTAAGEPGAMPPAPAAGGQDRAGMPDTPGPGTPIATGDQAEETRVPPAGASEPALPFSPSKQARVKESEKERIPPTSPHGATQPGGGSIGGRSGSVGRNRS